MEGSNETVTRGQSWREGQAYINNKVFHPAVSDKVLDSDLCANVMAFSMTRKIWIIDNACFAHAPFRLLITGQMHAYVEELPAHLDDQYFTV